MLYLVDDARDDLYADYVPLPGAEADPQGFGLTFIDHLTHNLFLGNMQKWSNYYEKLFNFREIRYFDIKGAKTGLLSKAMTAPDGVVRIPLNESSDEKSQINEYLRDYQGEGIQHIALFTDTIYDTVEKMRAAGVDTAPVSGRKSMRSPPLPRTCASTSLVGLRKRIAKPQADGPCFSANAEAKESGVSFSRKLMVPWRKRVMARSRWRETALKPSLCR
jgi:hypothetical protein